MPKTTHGIRTGARPSGSGSYGTAAEMKAMILSTDPQAITTAAGAYDKAAGSVGSAQDKLYKAAQLLAEHWHGPAAQKALTSLRRLHTTAGELTLRANATGQTFKWYGGTILPMYRELAETANTTPPKGPPSPTQAIADTAMTAAMTKVMQNLNSRIGDTWDGIPPQVVEDLPHLHGHDYERAPVDPSSGTHSHVPGSGSSHGKSQGTGSPPGGHNVGHGGDATPGGHHSSSDAPPGGGTDLAGANPPPNVSVPPGSSPSPSGPTGPASLGPGGIPPIRPGMGPLGFGPPTLGPTGPGSLGRGRDSLRPGAFPDEVGPSAAREVLSEEAMAAQAAARSAETEALGAVGSPMIGGGGDKDERERELTVWLAEDRFVWMGDEEYAPPVIGEVERQAADVEFAGDNDLSIIELRELLDQVNRQLTDETSENVNGAFGSESPASFGEEFSGTLGEVPVVGHDDPDLDDIDGLLAHLLDGDFTG